MPTIEIIPLRFNLDKEYDRTLFEELQKRSDPGKRTEFIKQVLAESFIRPAAGKAAARGSKKLPKEQDAIPAAPAPSEAGLPSPDQQGKAPGSGTMAKPTVRSEASEEHPGEHEGGTSGAEAGSSIASQFMQ